MLLWLSLEYMVGLQDTYIAFYPYVSLLSVVIPVVCYRMALKEKIEKLGKLTFKQAFISGLIITLFTCLLAVPVQLVFHKFINPDFFETMIQYSAKSSKLPIETAAMFYNIGSSIIESVLFTIVTGIIISLVFALWMRTEK